MSILLKRQDDPIYSAIFLEKLTVEDLKKKIAERYNLENSTISSICKISKKGLTIRIDDSLVEHFEEEIDFIIETTDNNGSISILLR